MLESGWWWENTMTEIEGFPLIQPLPFLRAVNTLASQHNTQPDVDLFAY